MPLPSAVPGTDSSFDSRTVNNQLNLFSYLPDSSDKMYGLTGFFLLLPFAYVAQVLTGRPEAAAIAYLPLLTAATIWMASKGGFRMFVADALRAPYDWLGLGVLFLALHTGVATVVGFCFGEFRYGIRGTIIYFLPLAIIPLVQRAEDCAILRLLKVFAMVGTLLAVELTYENVKVYVVGESTWFQLQNFAYVHTVSGVELSRLFGISYRPTGLLEHVHATVFFVGICAVTWLMMYFLEGRRYQLAMFSFCSAVFAIHGARLAFVALTIGVMTLIFSQLTRDRVELQKVKTASLVFGVTVFLVLLLDPFGTVEKYYFPALLQNDFQIANGGTPLSIYRDETARYRLGSPIGQLLDGRSLSFDTAIQALFGFGVVRALQGTGGTSDDAFFLQILGQYGLLGSIVFYGMWIAAIHLCYRTFARPLSSQRRLAGFAMAVLIILLLSIIHSPAVQRKAIYPVFIFALALAYRLRPITIGSATKLGIPPHDVGDVDSNAAAGMVVPPSIK